MEIALWFTPAEIASWRSVQTEWVYEEEELRGAEPVQNVDGLVASSEDDMVLASKLSALELETRVNTLEGGKPAAAAPAPAAAADEDDDDVDLFGSDDEEDDAEKKRITEERLAAYAAKKAKKPAL